MEISAPWVASSSRHLSCVTKEALNPRLGAQKITRTYTKRSHKPWFLCAGSSGKLQKPAEQHRAAATAN